MKALLLFGFAAVLTLLTACITVPSIATIPSKVTAAANDSPGDLVPTNSINADFLWLVGKMLSADMIITVDEHYERPTKENWRSYFPTNNLPYVEERWDCDDYAFRAFVYAREQHALRSTNNTSLAVGIIAYEVPGSEGLGHAANIIFLESGEIFVWDPRIEMSIMDLGDIYFIIW